MSVEERKQEVKKNSLTIWVIGIRVCLIGTKGELIIYAPKQPRFGEYCSRNRMQGVRGFRLQKVLKTWSKHS